MRAKLTIKSISAPIKGGQLQSPRISIVVTSPLISLISLFFAVQVVQQLLEQLLVSPSTWWEALQVKFLTQELGAKAHGIFAYDVQLASENLVIQVCTTTHFW